MALSDDQRAMLQLLLERGQSYEDIGSLLGLEVDEVRGRARAALTEIGGEDPDREVGLTDYLLGQADPIGRADAARHLQSDPASRDLAARLATQLRVLAPTAQLPDLPGVRGRPERAAKPAAPAPARGEAAAGPGVAERLRGSASRLAAGLSRGQRQMIAALFGAGVLVVVIVMVATGVFGGGDSDEPIGSNGGSGSQGDGLVEQGALAEAVLTARDGSQAVGRAVLSFVRSGDQDLPVLQIIATDLKPAPAGQSYFVWLYRNDRIALLLAREDAKNGRLSGLTPIPTAAYQALQRGVFDSIDVSLTSESGFRREVNRARQRRDLPRYTGESILRGPLEVTQGGRGAGQGPGSGGSGSGGGSGDGS
jgi:hypothetical protein